MGLYTAWHGSAQRALCQERAEHQESGRPGGRRASELVWHHRDPRLTLSTEPTPSCAGCGAQPGERMGNGPPPFSDALSIFHCVSGGCSFLSGPPWKDLGFMASGTILMMEELLWQQHECGTSWTTALLPTALLWAADAGPCWPRLSHLGSLLRAEQSGAPEGAHTAASSPRLPVWAPPSRCP